MTDDLRARILGARDELAKQSVDIPEWDVTVYLRRLSLHERFGFEAVNGAFEDLDRKKDPEKYVAWLVRYVIATACLSTGERLFSPDDEGALRTKAGTAIERMVLAALKVNVVSAEEIAEMGKGSSPVRNGSSASASPVTSG